MRKKLLTKTYLRGVQAYTVRLLYGEPEEWCAVKTIERAQQFVLADGTCLIDHGFILLEILPKGENYAVRLFLDRQLRAVQAYCDITLQNGLDEETGVPFYDDAYLDVIVHRGEIILDDEDELQAALDHGRVTPGQAQLIRAGAQRLIDEIRRGENPYVPDRSGRLPERVKQLLRKGGL